MRALAAGPRGLLARTQGVIAPPLIQRELIGLLRTKLAFWAVILTATVSGLVPLLVWPSEREMATRGAENARTVFSFFLAQIAASLLLLPALTAGAIAGEREQDTYEALYTTLIPPAGIVLSKALAACSFVVILLVASSPALFILYLLGGVDFGTILRGYAVALAALVFATLLGLKASMSSTRTSQAVVRGVRAVLRWNIGLALVAWLLLLLVMQAPVLGGGAVQATGFILCIATPLVALVDLVLLGAGGIGGAFALSWEPWAIYVCGVAILSCLCFRGLLVRARTPHLAPPRWLERARAQRSAARTGRPRRRTLLTAALLSRGERSTGGLANPIFLKEIRTEFFGRAAYRRSLFWTFLALFGLLACVPRTPTRWCLVAIGEVAAAVLVLLAPGVTATAFSREIEHQNLDFLRGTHLSTVEILRGKFLAGLYGGIGIVAAAAWVSGALLLCADFISWSYLRDDWAPGWDERLYAGSVLMAILVTTLVVATAISALAATLSRRSVTAILAAYAGIFAVFLGWPIFLGLAAPHDTEGVLFATSPFALLGRCLVWERRDYLDGVGYLVVFTILFSLFTVTLWGLATLRAEARFGRDP